MTEAASDDAAGALSAGAEQLEHLVALPMPFGKYKGHLIADLPSAYLNWFAREGFPRGEIGRLLALMHAIDQGGVRKLLDPLRASARRAEISEKNAG